VWLSMPPLGSLLCSSVCSFLCCSHAYYQSGQAKTHLQSLSAAQVVRRATVFTTKYIYPSANKCTPARTFWEASNVGALLFSWAFEGFPKPKTVSQLVHNLYAVLLQWAMPDSLKYARTSQAIWTLLSTCSTVLGLYHLAVHDEHEPHFRQMLRAMSPSVQRAILLRDCSKPWKHYVVRSFCALWMPERFPKQWSSTYIAFSLDGTTWYVGKSKCIRTHKLHVWSGHTCRHKEHHTNTKHRKLPAAHRDRYESWRHLPPHKLCMVPTFWGPTKAIMDLETAEIRGLRPPTQLQEFEQARAREKPPRPWRKHRPPKSIESECRLNILLQIRHSVSLVLRLRVLWCSYVQFRSMFCKKNNKTYKQFEREHYTRKKNLSPCPIPRRKVVTA